MAGLKPTRKNKAIRVKKSKVEPETTTVKVSRRVRLFIEEKSNQDESVNETLQRLLKLPLNGQTKASEPIPLTTTIKVSRDVMDFIQAHTKSRESREMTLGRLLGIELQDGNFPKAASMAKGMDRKATSVKPHDGNVQVTT